METTYNAKDRTLTVTLPCDPKGKASESGKSLIHASTHGNVKVQVEGLGTVSVGVNVYSAK